MSKILPIRRSKREARRYYDRISGVYDWMTSSEKDLIKQGINLMSISPEEAILEIGCGTGTGLTLISRAFSGNGTVVGLDLSHHMLLQSQDKTNSPGYSPSLIQSDAVHLPLQEGIFDGVFCSFTLELFSIEDITAVLHEIKRVLKPSGRLGVVALAQDPRNLAVKLYELMHQLFPVAVDCRPIPLHGLLKNNGYIIHTSKKSLNWGLPVNTILSKLS